MTDDHRYTDPAVASLPHAAYDDPRFNPIAFLPVPPEPGRRVQYGEATDWAATEAQSSFAKDDGSTYVRVDPAEFDSFDEVDSTTIVDDGSPTL